jgi:hypothetical protein
VSTKIQAWTPVGNYELSLSYLSDNALNYNSLPEPIRIPITIVQKSYYDTWLDAHSLGAHTASGPTMDADQDGSSNLMEFALGTDPMKAQWEPASLTQVGLPIVPSPSDSAWYLGFWLHRGDYDLGLDFTAQFSEDGQQWTDVAVTDQDLDWTQPPIATPFGHMCYCRVYHPNFSATKLSPTHLARLKITLRPQAPHWW